MKHIKTMHIFESEQFNLKSANMLADFNMLNKMMFDGEIKPVPLRLMRTKYKLGVMAYTSSGDIEYVGISDFYSITRQQYLDILAHEMIHVWMEQKGMRERDHHGTKFMSKLEELNKKFPQFGIRRSENAADYNVSGSTKSKEYGVVLFAEDDKFSLVAVNSSVVDDDKALDEFVEGIKKHALSQFKKLKIRIYKSSHPDIPKFKVKRNLSLKSLELFVLTPELAKEIMMEDPIREVTLK